MCDNHAHFIKSSDLLSDSHFEKPNVTCDEITNNNLIGHTSSVNLISLDFDVLVASDGAHSKIRSYVNSSFETLTKFNFKFDNTNHWIHFSDEALVGYTVIAKYKVNNGICPEIKNEHKNNPFVIGSIIDGVSSVFKRFFFHHCEIQIAIIPSKVALFDTSEDVPWELILEVSQEILIHPPLNIQHLQEQLFEVPKFLEIPIKRINPTSVFSFPISKTLGTKHIIFVGDAQVSALYRLATGVNFQFSNLHHLRRIFQLNSNKQHEVKHWNKFKQEIDKRMDTLISSQLSSLFFESVCGLVVFQDEFWRHDGNNFIGPISNEQALISCNRSAVPNWSII